MLAFQDEEIVKGEKKIQEWRSKFVSLQSRIDNNLGNVSEQFEDMLISLDEMRIRIERLKTPVGENFEKIKIEIKEIDSRIELEFNQIKKKLYS